MTPARVLIVEDDPVNATLLSETLGAEGFEVHALDTGRGVVDWVRAESPDCVLLDVGLPIVDGLTICRELRKFSAVPVIMLSARVEEIDRLLGLELGADDYVCKPFSPREVIARVRALLRRSRVAAGAEPSGPALALDNERFEARLQGALLPLTRVEFRLLGALATLPGRVLSRAQLLDCLYMDHRIVSDRTVDSHVRNLRKKIAEACPGVDPVESVYGLGYKYVAP
jgi:two-component system response regulator BaeR